MHKSLFYKAIIATQAYQIEPLVVKWFCKSYPHYPHGYAHFFCTISRNNLWISGLHNFLTQFRFSHAFFHISRIIVNQLSTLSTRYTGIRVDRMWKGRPDIRKVIHMVCYSFSCCILDSGRIFTGYCLCSICIGTCRWLPATAAEISLSLRASLIHISCSLFRPDMLYSTY